MDRIIHDNNKYYIKHEKGSTFSINEDLLQREKGDLFQRILNTDKKISKSKSNKANLAEVKRIKNQAVQMDGWRTWVKLFLHKVFFT